MASYKANWQRKKLHADGQLLSYRLKEITSIVRAASVSEEEANQFEVDIDAFVDSVKDWRAEVLADLTSRVVVPTEE